MHFGPNDEDAAIETIDRLVAGFEQATGRQGWVPHQLLHFKWGYLDGRLDHWLRAHLETLLLDIFPRKVIVDPDDLGQIVPEAKAFLRWLADTNGITGDPLPRLLHALDQFQPEVISAMQDTRRFGMGKSLATHMGMAGIDLQDPQAVQGFMEAFNARPMDQRKAMLPLPGDQVVEPGPDSPPLPPLVPVSAEQITATASSSPMYGWVRGLVDHVGSGKPLTKKGNLRVADGRALAARLDINQPIVDAEDNRLRSTEQLPDLDLAFRVAKAGGFLKVLHGKIQPTKRAATLWDDPAQAWPRVALGLTEVGILDHHYGPQAHLVPPWVQQVDDSVNSLLIALYIDVEPTPIDDLVDLTRQELARTWQISPPDPDDSISWSWWKVVDLNIRTVFKRLAQIGVITVADIQVTSRRIGGYDAGDQELGGTVQLTPAGRLTAATLARRAGVEVPEAGRLRNHDAATLLQALADAPLDHAVAELQVWIHTRGPEPALDQIAGALSRRPADLPLPVAAAAVTTCADAAGPDLAAPVLRGLMEDRLLRPIAGGWLLEHGVEDVTEGEPLDGLVTMAALGLADQAVISLQEQGPAATQQDILESLRADRGQQAVALLQATSDLHPDKTVAKAARKALFRLGVRG